MRPLVRAEWLNAPSEALIADVQAAYPYYSREAILDVLDREAVTNEYWINDKYQVCKRVEGEYTHLNIRRRDGAPILRDWRHFQAIKNQLVGAEAEAVELYPAESRLVDTSNKYHLYCLQPGKRFPFGFTKRDVLNNPGNSPGTTQRALGKKA